MLANKVCTECGIEKPRSDYYLRKNGHLQSGRCKACTNACKKRKAAEEKWRDANPDQIRRARDARKYGISAEESDRLRAVTNCQICGVSIEGMSQHIDHCHETGRVRGVLCTNCNLMLGNAKDNPETLRRAIDYLL